MNYGFLLDPLKPHFYYISTGLWGSFFTRRYFHDVVGETGQIIGETGVGETGVGEMGVRLIGELIRHPSLSTIF